MVAVLLVLVVVAAGIIPRKHPRLRRHLSCRKRVWKLLKPVTALSLTIPLQRRLRLEKNDA
jgi:hypothetical protein